MKKLVSLLLAALMLLCCCSALAEEAVSAPEATPIPEPTPVPAPFVFRGGLTWGMSAEEVIAIEGVAPNDTLNYSYHITKLVFYNRPVSSFNCTVTYWFYDGGLAQAQMQLCHSKTSIFFEDPEEVVTMRNALTYAYGKPTGVETMSDAMSAIADGVIPAFIMPEVDIEHVFDTWQPAADAEITLIYHDDYIYLHYINRAIDWYDAINAPAPVVTPVPNINGL